MCLACLSGVFQVSSQGKGFSKTLEYVSIVYSTGVLFFTAFWTICYPLHHCSIKHSSIKWCDSPLHYNKNLHQDLNCSSPLQPVDVPEGKLLRKVFWDSISLEFHEVEFSSNYLVATSLTHKVIFSQNLQQDAGSLMHNIVQH